MTSWEALRVEINDTEEWTNVQAEAGLDYGKLCRSAANQLATKLSHCADLDTKACTTLGADINKLKWTEGRREFLTEAIAKRAEVTGWRANKRGAR